jgi:HSP20 family molecular chaperone IbpA
MNIKRKWLAPALAAAACIGFLAGGSFAGAPDNTKSDSSGFIDRLKSWQDAMSKTFRETFEKLRKDSEATGPYIGTASVDLREQEENYILRLNLPGRSLEKVELTLKDDILHIVAPAEAKLGRYQQSVTLPGAKLDGKPGIERKQAESLIVVTVPKSSTHDRDGSGVFDAPLLPLLEWDRDVFSRMERMQKEMDRLFEEGFKEFRRMPGHEGFFDKPRFGSAVDLKEEGGNYVVRAYLPGRDMNNVTVNVDDRTLKIEARAEETKNEEKDKGTIVSKKSHYSQLLTLPGPVHVEKMKVDRKEGMLVITLPKAEE